MKRDEVEQLVRSRIKKSSVPDPRSSGMGVDVIEAHFKCRLPEGLAEMRELIGEYCISGDHLPQDEMIRDYEWELKHNPNWTEDFIPFYSVGNGDYLCFRRRECPHSGVYYVAHDDPQVQKLHDSFDDYLRDPDWLN